MGIGVVNLVKTFSEAAAFVAVASIVSLLLALAAIGLLVFLASIVDGD